MVTSNITSVRNFSMRVPRNVYVAVGLLDLTSELEEIAISSKSECNQILCVIEKSRIIVTDKPAK